MFTVKIRNEEQDNTLLMQWNQVRSHGPFSEQFNILKQDAIDRACTSEVADNCQLYYAWIGDGDGNEHWLAIGDDCFITDVSGKTVMIHRSPEPIGGPDGWREDDGTS